MCRSVTKLCLTLQPHKLQHAKLPFPSLSPRVCSSSCPLSHWCHPTSHSLSPLPLLPSVFPRISLFQWVGSSHQVTTGYWNFSFSVSPSSEYLGLVSFRMDWLDLLAVQGTLKSLLLHYNRKAWILQCSAFFMVQLSHLYMTTGKIIVLTIRTFVSQVMSLLFDTLFRFVIVFLPRSKCLCQIPKKLVS